MALITRAITPKRKLTMAEIGRLGGLKNSKFNEEKLVKAANEYIKELNADPKKLPTLQQLCINLNITEGTLHRYKKKSKRFKSLTKKIKMRQLQYLMNRSLDRYNPVGAIFLMKVMHGFKDTSKLEVTGKDGQPIQIVGGMLHPKVKKKEIMPIEGEEITETYNKELASDTIVTSGVK